MSTMFIGKTYWVPLVIAGLGAMTIASAQTVGSPFASKKAKQAWEVESPVTTGGIARPSTPSGHTGYSGALDRIPSHNTPVNNPVNRAPVSSGYTYRPPAKPAPNFENVTSDNLYGARPTAPSSSSYESSQPGAYYPGRQTPSYVRSQPSAPQAAQFREPYQGGPTYQGEPTSQYSGQYQGRPQSAGPSQYNYPNQGNYQGNQQNNYPPSQKPLRSTSWFDRLGFGNIKTSLKGFFRGGIAGTRVNPVASPSSWRDDYIGDANIEAEASAITQGGLEYGVNLEVRGQYDGYRRGFGGRVGDCPATVPGCASTNLATPTAVRGHTSQFYTDGSSNAKDFEVALEGAYIFLRSAYGDVTLGRDDGSAYLFSLGAPTLLAVNASNSPVDYTGLDSVKTINDASGFAEKITYTSPRLLGDRIGFGVQVGASYAPNARACGVDYCVRQNGEDGTGVLSPDLSDVIEFGVALDRKFNNGIDVEATFTYARASEDSGLAVFDDLESWNTGLEVSLNDWTIGGSYLQSNNGLTDGDYIAWDAGITWKPSKLGFTASYGHAEDENINLISDQAVLGVSYEFDRFTLGTGVQYIERSVPIATGLAIAEETEKATALFVEGGFTF